MDYVNVELYGAFVLATALLILMLRLAP